MACPHYSRDSGECALLEDVAEDEEEGGGAPVEEPVSREWCLSGDTAHRSCPVFRRFLAELLP